MSSRRDLEVVLLLKLDKRAILFVSKNNEADVIMWVLSATYEGGVMFEEVDVVC